MKNLIIKKLYATADSDGNYVNVSTDKQDCIEWLNHNNKEEVSIIEGYCVFDSDKNVVADDARDFHYDYHEALRELEYMLLVKKIILND